MASGHVSVPKFFSDEDAREWFQRFEICSSANQWNNETKARKLPTVLEGEALACWLELSDEQQADYKVAKEQLLTKMAPNEFVSLEEFHSRTMRPGEAIALYLHDLKRLLRQAMPRLTEEASDPLLLHQFLSGLPGPISRQLRASSDTKDLRAVVQRAKVLMTVMEHEQVAAMTATSTTPSEVDQLKTQITQLTEQVAALTTKQKNERPKRCFCCNQLGHIQRNCPTRFTSQRCYICNRPGHYAKDCWQGNDRGMSARGRRHPLYQ